MRQTACSHCLFPIVHEDGTHRHPISETKIDYSVPWVMQHKRAIVSAYRTSAYFEYYQDELFDILDSCPERLLDLNLALLRFFIDKTGLAVDLRLTREYSPEGMVSDGSGAIIKCEDFRESIHPKRKNTILADLELEKPYFQVFSGNTASSQIFQSWTCCSMKVLIRYFILRKSKI